MRAYVSHFLTDHMTSIQVIEILNGTSLVSCTFLHAMIISSFNKLEIA